MEADLDYLGLKGSTSTTAGYPSFAPSVFTINAAAGTDWLLTAPPQLGFAAGNWLFYATGGVAVTNLKGNFAFGGNFCTLFTCVTTAAAAESASFNTTKIGWTAGGGIEARLGGNWSIKAEYLFVDFGSVSVTSTNLTAGGSAFPSSVFTHSLTASIARVGLNYRFGRKSRSRGGRCR